MTSLFPVIILIIAGGAFVRQVIRWHNARNLLSKKHEFQEMVGIGLVGTVFTFASLAADGYAPLQFGINLVFILFLSFMAWTRAMERTAAHQKA